MAEAGAGITISGRNPVLYELLSIGQTFVNSADALILRNAAEAAGLSLYLVTWASLVRYSTEPTAHAADRIICLRIDVGPRRC
jgi:hypothetical protein